MKTDHAPPVLTVDARATPPERGESTPTPGTGVDGGASERLVSAPPIPSGPRPCRLLAMTDPAGRKALLVHPRFAGTSFWNYRTTCALRGARYSAAPLGLITVAALPPPGWKIRLVDRNVQELDDDDLAWADVVMTGGMLPQRNDVLSLIEAAHARGKPVVVGGPDSTCSRSTTTSTSACSSHEGARSTASSATSST